jgi:DNA-binding IclR family transcriptional regulator
VTAASRTVVGKIAAILLTFTNGAAHSFTEIVAATDLPLSTAHRLISQLTAAGILERTADGDYRVGAQLRSIGAARRPPPTFEGLSSLLLQDLSDALDLEVRLGVLGNHGVVFVEKAPGRRPVPTFSAATIAPAHATAMGKALLAFSPFWVVTRFLERGLPAYTEHTITSHARFEQALALTRRTGVAVSWREHEPDRSGLAVPVFDSAKEVVAAVEIPVDDPSTALAKLRPTLALAGRRLSRELSFHGPHDLPAVLARRGRA